MVVLKRTVTNKKQHNLNKFLEHLSSSSTASYKVKSKLEKRLIADILFDICEDCNNMATLPQGAFAACKLREQYKEDRGLIVSRMKSTNDKSEAKNMSSNKKLMEYSPVKYNSKLMNSIWGLYNRYSPHNIKSDIRYVNNDQDYFVQQQIAVASLAIAKNLAMAQGSGKEWSFPLDKENSKPTSSN